MPVAGGCNTPTGVTKQRSCPMNEKLVDGSTSREAKSTRRGKRRRHREGGALTEFAVSISEPLAEIEAFAVALACEQRPGEDRWDAETLIALARTIRDITTEMRAEELLVKRPRPRARPRPQVNARGGEA